MTNSIAPASPMPLRLSPALIPSLAGRDLGPSRWHEVTQAQIDRFADVTGDHAWIHVDVDRAAREADGTIAHGFLTASLLPALLGDLVEIGGAGFNYGLDRVRFVAPVRAGKRIRLRATGLEPRQHHGGQILGLRCTVEIEGAPQPALVADWFMLLANG